MASTAARSHAVGTVRGAAMTHGKMFTVATIIFGIGFFLALLLTPLMEYCGRRAARAERPNQFLSAPAVLWLVGGILLATMLVCAAIFLSCLLAMGLNGGQP